MKDDERADKLVSIIESIFTIETFRRGAIEARLKRVDDKEAPHQPTPSQVAYLDFIETLDRRPNFDPMDGEGHLDSAPAEFNHGDLASKAISLSSQLKERGLEWMANTPIDEYLNSYQTLMAACITLSQSGIYLADTNRAKNSSWLPSERIYVYELRGYAVYGCEINSTLLIQSVISKYNKRIRDHIGSALGLFYYKPNGYPRIRSAGEETEFQKVPNENITRGQMVGIKILKALDLVHESPGYYTGTYGLSGISQHNGLDTNSPMVVTLLRICGH